jgi:hypothetical protein
LAILFLAIWLAIWFSNSVWQFSLAVQFGNSVWQFSSAIQFDNSVRQFDLAIRQFSLAVQFSISFWQLDLAIQFGDSVWQDEFNSVWLAFHFGKSIWHLWVGGCHGRSACMFGLNDCLHIKLCIMSKKLPNWASLEGPKPHYCIIQISDGHLLKSYGCHQKGETRRRCCPFECVWTSFSSPLSVEVTAFEGLLPAVP